MTPEQLRRDEANRWLAIAGKDLNAARLLAAVEPTGSVFHSQQAAEKAVVFRYLDAPREPDEAEATGALETARRLYDHVRALLAPAQEP
jgi:hypothetical protein